MNIFSQDEKWENTIKYAWIPADHLIGNMCTVSEKLHIIPALPKYPTRSFCLKKNKTFNHFREESVRTGYSPSSSAVVVNDVVYVFNEDSSFKVMINEKVPTSLWTPLSPMADGTKQDFASGELNGTIYVCGGNKFSTNIDRVQAYSLDEGETISITIIKINSRDSFTDRWSYVAAMTTARSFHSEIYNLTIIGLMCDTNLGVVSLRGYLYAIGGANYLGGHTNFKSVERYDPGSNSWALVADMKCERAGHEAVTHAGKIYVFGGWGEEVRKLFAKSPNLQKYF